MFDFYCTGKKGRTVRYQTQEMYNLIEKLEEAEDEFKNSLVPFLRSMFRTFYRQRDVFMSALQCAAEIDCLCTLACVSADQSLGPMVKPEILDSDETEPFLELV